MISVEAFICCVGCLEAVCFFLLFKLFEAQKEAVFYQHISEGYKRQLEKAEKEIRNMI